jgi:hypothetical protein
VAGDIDIELGLDERREEANLGFTEVGKRGKGRNCSWGLRGAESGSFCGAKVDGAPMGSSTSMGDVELRTQSSTGAETGAKACTSDARLVHTGAT